jgi:geranylgeranyl pyrophosphate synthase
MHKKQYISYLSETSDKIFPLLEKEIEGVAFQETELSKILSFFYTKRENKLLLKPTLFRLAYEICGGKDFEKIKNIAAAFEALNISSYQANSAFDNKMGILQKEAKDDQFIASMLSREIATKLVLQSTDTLPFNTINKIIECISVSNLYIYKAQHYDLNLLSDANYEKYAASEYKFNTDYHNRCYYGSGIFSGKTVLAGAIVANADKEQQKSLQLFGEIYGTALHKINDLADFFPGEERNDKLYQDNYCDIRNNRLTFPVYKLRTMYEDKYNELYVLVNDNSKTNIIQTVNDILADTTLTEDVRKMAREAYNEAKQALSCFEMSESKKMILTLLSILDSNKFYYRAKNSCYENLA